MLATFLTNFNEPIKTGTYPAEVRVLVAADTPPPLYLEQRYYRVNGSLLETISKLIPESAYGGQVVVQLNEDYLNDAAYFEVQIVNQNNQALATGNRVSHAYTPEPAALPQFLTGLKTGTLAEGFPASTFILIDEQITPPLYFERRYLNYDGSQLEIRSTEIPVSYYGRKIGFKLNENWLPCAYGVEVSIQSTNRSVAGACPGGTPSSDNGIFDFTFDFTFE